MWVKRREEIKDKRRIIWASSGFVYSVRDNKHASNHFISQNREEARRNYACT